MCYAGNDSPATVSINIMSCEQPRRWCVLYCVSPFPNGDNTNVLRGQKNVNTKNFEPHTHICKKDIMYIKVKNLQSAK